MKKSIDEDRYLDSVIFNNNGTLTCIIKNKDGSYKEITSHNYTT